MEQFGGAAQFGSMQNDEMEVVKDTEMRRASAVSVSDEKPAVMERVWGYAARVDPTVTVEEYMYWAKIEREMEAEETKTLQAENGKYPFLSLMKSQMSADGRAQHKAEKQKRADMLRSAVEASADGKPFPEKSGSISVATPEHDPLKVSDAEWRTAARAMRTASWGMYQIHGQDPTISETLANPSALLLAGQMFFLITTDILGWSGAPFVFASVGYGAGVALYVIFGAAATFSGWAIWKVYMDLDSSRYPMQSFGDPFFRMISTELYYRPFALLTLPAGLFGAKARHFINVAQSLQQFLTVAVLVLSKSNNISQLSHNSICYVAVMLIVMGIGMLSGIIRSLQKIGWLSYTAVFMNIANFLIIMVASATAPPDYTVVTNSTLIKGIHPIVTFAGRPPADYQQQAVNFASQFNAVNTMVYAYAGALLFVAFLAEMRNPMDFWKALFCAQAFICIVYLLFGIFVYSNYGQYSPSTIVNAIQPFSLQSVGNVFTMLTGFIAVFMYFNIGMKTVYLEVFQQVFNFPPITTKKGRIMWYILGPIYWIFAFIIAAAVPNINGIVSLIGALFMINFTYSFPGMLYLGKTLQAAAILPGEGFNPANRVTTRHDTGMKRWTRAFKKTWKISGPLVIYILAGLACCGIGTWAAVEGLIEVFGPNGTKATSFGCGVPL
ncbi:uncharacterized protein LTR77_002553 [Saxophila tyrrhenica]|uniref:Amino acid transporter transmembrane domain-containing protein n=1 Tax=Saxophila tyrrhenica TaxID=1690608 RepID=A0AAV9PIV3_9PEZI|nr:hypothetical protein LTR77_002553 [Saxophila tyrrhenica]